MSTCLHEPPRTCLTIIGLVCLLTVVASGAEEARPAAPAASAERTQFEKAIRTVEPSLAGSPDHLAVYLRLFQREYINDLRLFPCRIEAASGTGGTIALAGFVGFDENRAAAQKLFEYLGFDKVDNRIEVLPSPQLGDKRFGLIRVTHSFSYDQPAGNREVVTDCLLGTPVYLLKEAADGYFLCHAMEGYVGYVHGQDLRRLDAAEFTRHQSGPHVRLLHNQSSESGLVLPMGARLKHLKRQQDQVLVALPDGGEATIPADSCRVDDGEQAGRIQRIIAAAERMLGTPYVWGGNTSEGIDCSGLVQTAFATEGITLARDASQQALAGRLVATRWHRDGLRRGDTLYFLSQYGKISHTALYLGDGRFIESVRPVVRYSSFDPASAEYSQRADTTFCFAKRLLE